MRALVICALLMLSFQASVLAQNAPPDKVAQIDEMMAQAHKYRLFNGSVLVAENGKVIYKKGYGQANGLIAVSA